MRNHRTDLGDERTTHWYDLILPVSRTAGITIRKGNPQRDGSSQPLLYLVTKYPHLRRNGLWMFPGLDQEVAFALARYWWKMP